MNISSIMSTSAPGTFVPDMDASEAPTITPLPSPDLTAATPDGGTGTGTVDGIGPGTSFKDTVKAFLGDVNDKLETSDQLTRDLATGKTNDQTKVVASVEEANLALSYTMAIRSKLLSAYSEIERITV